MRLPYCPVQRSVVCLRVSEKQVVAHRVIEDVGVLGDDPDPRPEILPGVAADIPAAETDLAAVGVPETKDQVDQRALSRAAWPHDRNPAAWPQNEGDVLQRRRTTFFVSEAHPVQRQRAVLWQGQGLGRVLDLGL